MMQTRIGARLGAAAAVGASVLLLGLATPAQAASANSNGANQDCATAPHPYCPNLGEASKNGGTNNGLHTGRPEAGTVGKADSKNPKGQFPDGHDANNGYECDGNSGIALGNPAHTDCAPVEPPL